MAGWVGLGLWVGGLVWFWAKQTSGQVLCLLRVVFSSFVPCPLMVHCSGIVQWHCALACLVVLYSGFCGGVVLCSVVVS